MTARYSVRNKSHAKPLPTPEEYPERPRSDLPDAHPVRLAAPVRTLRAGEDRRTVTLCLSSSKHANIDAWPVRGVWEDWQNATVDSCAAPPPGTLYCTASAESPVGDTWTEISRDIRRVSQAFAASSDREACGWQSSALLLSLGDAACYVRSRPWSSFDALLSVAGA